MRSAKYVPGAVGVEQWKSCSRMVHREAILPYPFVEDHSSRSLCIAAENTACSCDADFLSVCGGLVIRGLTRARTLSRCERGIKDNLVKCEESKVRVPPMGHGSAPSEKKRANSPKNGRIIRRECAGRRYIGSQVATNDLTNPTYRSSTTCKK